MSKIDVLLEIRELKNHLSYSKNIGFFAIPQNSLLA